MPQEINKITDKEEVCTANPKKGSSKRACVVWVKGVRRNAYIKRENGKRGNERVVENRRESERKRKNEGVHER